MLTQFCVWYLKRAGWVVFYLDIAYRHCGAVCWLKEYNAAWEHVPPPPEAG